MSVRRTRLLLICLAGTLIPAGYLHAQRADTPDAAISDDVFFVLGNIEYILLHEIAHMLIGDLEIPIIGSEESAADYMATTALIHADRFDPTRAERAREYLFATASALANSWDFEANVGSEIQYWDSHSLTIQRFFQIVCLIYGSDPEAFAALPALVGLPMQRATRCPSEYARADRSMQWLLDNYGASEEFTNAQIEVVYEAVPSRTSGRIVDAIRASGMIDNTVRRLDERFRVPKEFRIVFQACGRPQALWLPEMREIAICYELLDSYYALAIARPNR